MRRAQQPGGAFRTTKLGQGSARRILTGRPLSSRSAEKVQEKLQVAAFTLAVALSQAGAADAAVTPSLKNLLLSVLAGGTVLAGIAVAIVGVSTFDKVTRK